MRQPKEGDVWKFENGEVMVYFVQDNTVWFLWQEATNGFHTNERTIDEMNKDAEYMYNFFDDDSTATPSDTEDAKHDIVNHPKHYTQDPSGIECIDVAEHLSFCLGNCYKYLHRAGLKDDELTDYKKALYYARRAYLNNETLSDIAKVRMLEVASHHYIYGIKHRAIMAMVQKPLGMFYQQLTTMIGELECQNAKKGV